MMRLYRKKPVVVRAQRWFMPGDHECVLNYYPGSDETACAWCQKPLASHGYIRTLEGGHIVCPGDWIIEGVKGEFYPCKPDVFEQTYEEVEHG